MKSMKILWVEDLQVDIALMQRVLEHNDKNKLISLEVVSTLHDAHGRERHADLILLDLNLPDSTPKQTIEYIRYRRHKSPPVVVFSGSEELELILEANNAGALTYLWKGQGNMQFIGNALIVQAYLLLKERKIRFWRCVFFWCIILSLFGLFVYGLCLHACVG